LSRLFAGVIQQAPGEQDVPLPRRYSHSDLYLALSAFEHHALAPRGGGYLLVHVRYDYLVAQRERGVVGLVLEAERQYAVIYEIRPVYPRKAYGDDALDAQIQRRKRRVLAARALAVVLASYDKAAAALLRTFRKI